MSQRGFTKASEAWAEYRGRLPWRTRQNFYLAISRGDIPSCKWGAAVYLPRWALEALANGDVEALNQARHPTGRVA